MSIIKKVEIDGKQVPFKASAAIPRIYRLKFQRDIYKDLSALEKSINQANPDDSNLDLFSLEIFENIAFVMAKHADPNIPDTPEEWLDEFNTFSIYQVLPPFLLRCVQLGLSMADLELLSIGLINDMYAESRNDDCKYDELATQEDFDRF